MTPDKANVKLTYHVLILTDIVQLVSGVGQKVARAMVVIGVAASRLGLIAGRADGILPTQWLDSNQVSVRQM